jgi:hypothetical protein
MARATTTSAAQPAPASAENPHHSAAASSDRQAQGERRKYRVRDWRALRECRRSLGALLAYIEGARKARRRATRCKTGKGRHMGGPLNWIYVVPKTGCTPAGPPLITARLPVP